jgi:hypothetical protein
VRADSSNRQREWKVKRKHKGRYRRAHCVCGPPEEVRPYRKCYAGGAGGADRC